MAHWDAEVRELLPQVESGNRETPARKGLADLQERIRSGEQRATDIQEQLLALDRGLIDEADVAVALAKFDPVWEALAPHEQVRLIDLLIERIDFDGGTGDVSITFHAGGIRELADQLDTEDAA